MEHVENLLRQAPGKLQLDLFSKQGFIGLMAVGTYYTFLEEVVTAFAAYVNKAGEKVALGVDGVRPTDHDHVVDDVVDDVVDNYVYDSAEF
jgi:hypothetical protein